MGNQAALPHKSSFMSFFGSFQFFIFQVRAWGGGVVNRWRGGRGGVLERMPDLPGIGSLHLFLSFIASRPDDRRVEPPSPEREYPPLVAFFPGNYLANRPRGEKRELRSATRTFLSLPRSNPPH